MSESHRKRQKLDQPSDEPKDALGELELVFSGNPSASDLYLLALDEQSGNPKSSATRPEALSGDRQDTRVVVTKIFEMAAEKFKQENPQDAQDLLVHASCLRDFGAYIKVRTMLEESIAIYSKVVQAQADSAPAWLGLGKARLLWIRSTGGITDDDDAAGKDSFNLEDAEEDEDDGLDELYKVPKTELEMFKKAGSDFENAQKHLKAEGEEARKNWIVVGSAYLDYALFQKDQRKKNPSHLIETLVQALRYIGKGSDAKRPDADALKLHGMALYYLADVKQKSSTDPRDDGSRETADAVARLSQARDLVGDRDSDLYYNISEMLGQAYILQSTTAADDDQVLEAYETGIEILVEVLAKYPDKTQLREQLEAFGVLDDDDDGEWDDEDAE
ncbi:uncharacterized protein BJ171DRAFT_582730 [Polychytrium aggregatum]|uniref:uncharacterized protein n=1 Tax=Polychytrium aggregatum TaxID=110093 RepID=UPI0022FEC4AC|nr:uncharacterized protein BJ171DRAFT_582730 [Polychytrium aggregatum]KAI9203586.1 hypothetical protein BJ171DRAFT_582730 [Polychytrium aggregatum]